MATNGISNETVGNPVDPVATKLKRRNDKLAAASAKRKITNTPGFRKLNVVVGSHTAYVGTGTTTVSGNASPVPGRPWA